MVKERVRKLRVEQIKLKTLSPLSEQLHVEIPLMFSESVMVISVHFTKGVMLWATTTT